MAPRIPDWLKAFSPGAWVMAVLALTSSGLILLTPPSPRKGMPFWIFSKIHEDTYGPIVSSWNEANPRRPVDLQLIQFYALERRLLSGFMAGTPVADLFETERMVASRSFAGPLDRVGFFDLTDRLKSEGLMEQFNAPSFSLWTSRGRIFGLPHDVHPVLMAYRADLVEAAGIDMAQIETWDDFLRVLRPLMQDFDGDGRVDRYLLSGWSTNGPFTEMLLLQGGGTLFDAQERPCFDLDVNVELVAKMISWFAGPDRMCTEAPEFTGSGHKMRLDGVVIASLIPDWMAGQWKRELPGLSGKIKLMPLPAWTKGGRRTSVWGGTMLGIARTTPDFEAAWAFAKTLYLSPALADALFEGAGIVTPVKAHWSRPIFHRPDPYFSGQPLGALYIAQAPSVPARVASPYSKLAIEKLTSVLVALQEHAQNTRQFTPESLQPEARRLLQVAQAELLRQIGRNRFLVP
ncbi:MAG: extracellular solute-binding protein [Opitutaceae bacterium]